MHVFTNTVPLAAGQSLGGYAGIRISAEPSQALEINGCSFVDAATRKPVELCSLDALYAGDLTYRPYTDSVRRIFAASHTHYAPMLDSTKPRLGAGAVDGIEAFARAIQLAPRRQITPDRCRIHRAAVPIPIYRRFDVPDTPLNRFLTARAGMYPNEKQAIDRHLYLFEFSRGEMPEFLVVQHACHPVSRQNRNLVSPDYVGAIRHAVRERFGPVPCLFFLGCAGDIRPNFAGKRVGWLPRSRLNWRFEMASSHNQDYADDTYAHAVRTAELWRSLEISADSFSLEHRVMSLEHQTIDIPCLLICNQLRFDFVPFEVSHFFHLEAQMTNPMRFIVSCSNHTRGYLPHSRQLAGGGYEVDFSRAYMGMSQRAVLSSGNTW
jgi:neutral ceramidase